MYHVFHKSIYSDGAVFNLIANSKNFCTFNFFKQEADHFVSQQNEIAESKNLTIRYFKLKSVHSKVAA